MRLNSIFRLVPGRDSQDREAKLYRDLLRREAKIGGKLFGPVPAGGRREFFCLDENTWIWHEEWIDSSKKKRVRTTRYDVRPNGVVKSQNGKHYQKVTAEELDRLYSAAKTYQQKTTKELYQAVAQSA